MKNLSAVNNKENTSSNNLIKSALIVERIIEFLKIKKGFVQRGSYSINKGDSL